MPALGHEDFARLSVEEWIDRIRARGGVPRHIAIIMDGNGRWARKRFLPRVAGHRAGRQAVRRTVELCSRLGVEVLTLYTFSQENWKRPAAEVSALWSFLEETLESERGELQRNRVRLMASGELASLPPPVQAVLARTIAGLAANDGLIVNLALAYGGRQEILRAATILARRVAAGELDPEAVNEAEFRGGFYSPDLPDPDLVIRTSGEGRLSNFLLWQSAYSELYFTSVLWPDFQERDLLLAISDFQRRERRFGEIHGEAPAAGGNGDTPLLDPTRWKRLLGMSS